MGTRGFLGVRCGDKLCGIYNQFDSYPSALGVDVVDFIKQINSDDGWGVLKQNILNLEFIDNNIPASPEHIEKYRKYADTRVSSGNIEEWYVLLREIQGIDTFKEIYKGNLSHISDDSKFMEDSLFCEYSYIINLNTNSLECYKSGVDKVGELSLNNITADNLIELYSKDECDECF